MLPDLHTPESSTRRQFTTNQTCFLRLKTYFIGMSKVRFYIGLAIPLNIHVFVLMKCLRIRMYYVFA